MNAKVALIALLAAAAGAGLTFVLMESGGGESRRSDRAAVDLHRRLEAAEAARDEAEEELARLRESRRTRAGTVTPKADAEAVAVPADPEARHKRVAHLRSQVEAWLEAGDGGAIGAALNEASRMNPEGFPLAAELYELLSDDYGPDSKLGHMTSVHVHRYLERVDLRDLMSWALEHPDANEDFRTSAAYRLPSIQGSEVTEEQYLRLIRTEQDSYILHTLVEGLVEIDTRGAHAGLLNALANEEYGSEVRLAVARTLAHPDRAQWAKQAVRKLADTERDLEVRAVLRAALLAYDTPATGALVVGMDEDAKEAGVRVGDIITRYGERTIHDHYDVRHARDAHKNSEHAIAVVLLREGRELTIRVPPGYLGLTLRSIEAR